MVSPDYRRALENLGYKTDVAYSNGICEASYVDNGKVFAFGCYLHELKEPESMLFQTLLLDRVVRDGKVESYLGSVAVYHLTRNRKTYTAVKNSD